jgi:phenylalanyl-tRNA synthetase beta chain
LRERLAAADYREVINFSFVEPAWEADFAGGGDPIRLLNPIASPLSVMRTSLIGSLVDVVRRNHSRKIPRIRVFEVGRAFLRDAGVPDGPLSVAGVRQPMRVAAAAFGPAFKEQWGVETRGVDFFDVKADVEALAAPVAARFETAAHPAFHPGRSARVLLDGRPAGWLGELHPRWQRKYELPQPAVLFELDVALLEAVPMPRFEPPSKYPPVARDISAVFASAVPVQAVLDAMQAEKPLIVRSVALIDVYRGEGVPLGSKSLAFRVVMQHTERTLTDAEADAARDELVALLGRKFSATLRT